MATMKAASPSMMKCREVVTALVMLACTGLYRMNSPTRTCFAIAWMSAKNLKLRSQQVASDTASAIDTHNPFLETAEMYRRIQEMAMDSGQHPGVPVDFRLWARV